MRSLPLLAGLSALAWAPGVAAQTGDIAAAPQTPASAHRLVAGTPISFAFVDQIDSKAARIDDFFAIRLSQPLAAGDGLVIPEGTPGVGQVVHAAKAGGSGKAGELIVTVRYLDFKGVRIPLRRFRLGEPGGIGTDRRDEAFGVSMAVPLAGLFIKGGEKIIPAGSHGTAIVAADTEIAPAAGI